jgi:transposase-like protein
MPWQKLNPEMVREVVSRFQAGESPVELANEFGVSRAAIDHHIRAKLGPRRRGKLSDEDRRAIVARWRAGEVAAELAREFGVGFSAVSKLILKATGQRIGRVRRKNEVFIPDDPVTLAYLAAMIDAEGCITRNSKSSACTWQVVITNTSPDLERWLNQFGGNFYYVATAKR